MRSAACWAASAWSSPIAAGANDLAADAVDLHGLDDGVDSRLPVRAARDQHRQLAGELDSFLGEQRFTAREPVGGFVGRRDDTHALAVVPAPRCLEHHRPADLVAEAVQLPRVCHHPPARAGDTELGQPRTHHGLVLRVKECIGTGAYDDAGLGEGSKVFGRDLLVVEGHHVAALGKTAQRLEIGLVADLGAGHDLGGTVPGVASEHAQRDAELDRRPSHHPRQLSPADDADHRECHAATLPSGAPGRPSTCNVDRVVVRFRDLRPVHFEVDRVVVRFPDLRPLHLQVDPVVVRFRDRRPVHFEVEGLGGGGCGRVGRHGGTTRHAGSMQHPPIPSRRLPASILQIAAHQDEVTTREQLASAGISDKQVSQRARKGCGARSGRRSWSCTQAP